MFTMKATYILVFYRDINAIVECKSCRKKNVIYIHLFLLLSVWKATLYVLINYNYVFIYAIVADSPIYSIILHCPRL